LIQTRIAQRYALAIFELAQEAGKTEEIGRDLDGVRAFLASDETVRNALLSPVVTRAAKAEVLQAVLEAASLEPLVANFLRVLLEARKLGALDDVVAVYDNMVDEVKGRVRGAALAAMPLDDADVDALAQALSRALEKEVILEAHTDPSILGGVVAQVGNLVFDGSVRTQLQRMKETLIKG